MSNFQAIDFFALLPFMIVLVTAIALLLVETFAEAFSKQYASWMTLAALIAAFIASMIAPESHQELLTPWIRFDALARFFTQFFLLIGIATTLLSSSFFQRFDASHGEYFFLQLSAIFGLMLIGASADFLTLFLGIETLSISLYVLCGYMKSWRFSSEAALKYFLMGSLAAAILVYGVALIYGATGTTSFADMSKGQQGILLYSGIALVALGLAFEAAIVPFQLWAPDVYDGASTPVTAFMAVGTKAGAFAAFIRVFLGAFPHISFWHEGIAFFAYPTLIYANIVALRQFQLRRFFAYSGISHAGFLLIPLVAGTPQAIPAMLFYLIVYAAATLGSFAVLSFLDERSEGVLLSDLSGLFKTSPYLAGTLSLCLLTLAGIPPSVGFFAKLYIFQVAFQAGYYSLVVVGLLTTIISAYYYMRIIAIMMSSEVSETKPLYTRPSIIVSALSAAIILLLTCYPEPILNIVEAMQ